MKLLAPSGGPAAGGRQKEVEGHGVKPYCRASWRPGLLSGAPAGGQASLALHGDRRGAGVGGLHMMQVA